MTRLEKEMREIIGELLRDMRLVNPNEPDEREIPCQHRVSTIRRAHVLWLMAFSDEQPAGESGKPFLSPETVMGWMHRASVAEIDTQRINWLESMMKSGDYYCEIYMAGLRSFDGQKILDAENYQVESNPEHFSTVQAKTLRDAIDEAICRYQEQRPLKGGSR